MDPQAFETYAAEHRAAGYDEVIERRWPADLVLETHTHPFEAEALVVQGEMWLTCGEDTRHLRPGDRFHLLPEEAHAERYGHDGATYWVARRKRSG